MLRKCTEWMEILGFGLVSCEEGGGGAGLVLCIEQMRSKD